MGRRLTDCVPWMNPHSLYGTVNLASLTPWSVNVASAIVCGLLSASIHGGLPQNLNHDELLARVGRYAQDTQQHLGALIGNETYHQDLWTQWPARQHTASRVIRSETLFISLTQDDAAWLPVWNVLSVDGRTVEDSKGRLDRTLKSPTTDALSQLRLLKAEGARYDIGQVWRTTGDPMLVFRFLLPMNQSRFTFGGFHHERIDGIDVVKIAFDERQHPTAITFNGQDESSHGALWVRPDDGTIVRTRLQLKTHTALNVAVVVTFSHDSQVDVWVPHRMEESYENAQERTACTATYANFRRFETSGRLILQ